jgi:hypothetical protein
LALRGRWRAVWRGSIALLRLGRTILARDRRGGGIASLRRGVRRALVFAALLGRIGRGRLIPTLLLSIGLLVPDLLGTLRLILGLLLGLLLVPALTLRGGILGLGRPILLLGVS